MKKLEITELPNNRFTIWYGGKNVDLNNDVDIPLILKMLHNCIHYLLSKL